MGASRRLHNKAVGIIRRAAFWASIQSVPGYAETSAPLLAAATGFRVASTRVFFRAFHGQEGAPRAGSCIALCAIGIDVQQ